MFNIDRNLNYGRDIVSEFASTISPLERVLDVGAGAGTDLMTIKAIAPESQLYGVEYYNDYGKKLRERGIEVLKINFENTPLPVEDEFFDLIISNQMLEHSKEVFWVLHEMSRSLKTGGSLILGVPNLASLHNRFLLLFGRQPTSIQNDSAHLRGFTKGDVQKLVSIFPNGYELQNFRGSNFYPFSPLLAKPLARILPTMAWANFFHFKKLRKYDEPFFIKHPLEKKLETNFFIGT